MNTEAADVEKIAREIATDIAKTRGEDQPHELEQAIIQMGITPLVEALEQCESALAAFLPLHPAGALARAALTGTGV